MQLIISKKGLYEDNIFDIYQKNYNLDIKYTPRWRYSVVLESDYWFDLIDSDYNILASCSIDLAMNIFSFIKPKTLYHKVLYLVKRIYKSIFSTEKYISIHDVFVEEKFRKNGYATILLEKVFSFIEMNLKNEFVGVFLLVDNDNIPALKLYSKFFGSIPFHKNRNDSVYLKLH